MATKVQSKTYFPGSMMDLNNGLCNNVWDMYHDDITSGSQKSQYYDSILMSQTMDGYPGYAKEQMRQTILKQDSIFRHQIHELHRLYKRQKDLMKECTTKEHYNFLMPTEAPNSSHFLSQVSSRNSKDMHSIFSPSNSLKGKSTLHEFGPLRSKSSTTQRRVIDLELPADVDDDNIENVHNISTERAYNLADLNEPIQMEEAPLAASFSNKNSDLWHKKEQLRYSYIDGKPKFFENGYRNGTFSNHSNSLQPEQVKPLENLPKKRTIFGVELCEKSHSPSSDSSTLHHTNHWLGSSDSSRKNHENRLPPWLMTKSNLCNEQSKGKEKMVYQMNLDSLQNHSQQFFKKAEINKSGHDMNVKIDNSQDIPKILGVPIINIPENSKNCNSKLRNQIDLNLTFEEEETPSYIPESVVKIAAMEIDLEAPAILKSETDSLEVIDVSEESVKSAAEAIMVISSSEVTPPPQQVAPPATTLQWFAEVISSNKNEELIPEGMDYLEYKTLKLEETQEYNCVKPMILEEKEEDESSLPKRITKKGNGKRGRQRKDFQRDVLPGIVTLSRREVNEDLQVFEEAFSGIGVSWESSLSKRKAAGKSGRGRRRSVVADPPSPPAPPPPPPPPAVEQISGWGKRTRRLPRQRCQNGGSHQSLALKC